VQRVIASGWFILGPEVEAFESEFAAASQASHAVGVGTGTDAITLIVRALGIGAGDEVITSPLSAAYSALAIMMAGARPVFADIDPIRLTIDPAAVERAITPRTRAIMPVHLYGRMADMAAIMAVAERHGLAAVHRQGSAHRGKRHQGGADRRHASQGRQAASDVRGSSRLLLRRRHQAGHRALPERRGVRWPVAGRPRQREPRQITAGTALSAKDTEPRP